MIAYPQNRPPQNVHETIASDLEQTDSRDNDKTDLVAKLPQLFSAQNLRLNLADFLWGDGGNLAESMTDVAKSMPTAPEFLFTSFLPIAASRLGTAATIVIKPEGNYKQPSIIRTCIVGKSGDMKSPAQAAVIEPLEELETEARERYKQEFADYEQELHQWEKNGKKGKKPQEPVCKRYILQNGSIESRIAIHTENPRGLLVYRDEWSAHLTGRNKYRQGKGDDAENELTEFNGGQLIKDVAEASKRLHLAKTAVSRTGTTQFETLKKLMSDHEDSTGEFGRWLFCAAPCPPAYLDLKSTGKSNTLGKYLKQLYRDLEMMPQQEYHLSDNAKGYYSAYHNSLVELGYSEQTPGIQIALPKMRSYFARFTLILHCVNQVLTDNAAAPATLIDDFTVVAASKLCNYFLAQLRLIYALNSPQEGLSGKVLHLKNWLEGKKDVTARQITRGLRQYQKLSKGDLERDLQILLDFGYITQEVKGKTIIYSSVNTSVNIFSSSVNTSVNKTKNVETAESIALTELIQITKNEVSTSVNKVSTDSNVDTESVLTGFDPNVSTFFVSPPELKDQPGQLSTDIDCVDEVLHVRNGASLITSSIRDANTDQQTKAGSISRGQMRDSKNFKSTNVDTKNVDTSPQTLTQHRTESVDTSSSPTVDTSPQTLMQQGTEGNNTCVDSFLTDVDTCEKLVDTSPQTLMQQGTEGNNTCVDSFLTDVDTCEKLVDTSLQTLMQQGTEGNNTCVDSFLTDVDTCEKLVDTYEKLVDTCVGKEQSLRSNDQIENLSISTDNVPKSHFKPVLAKR
ncbi:MAG: DUF3987 domain-containing protein [Brasilonema angustatum HA4187-MV1]|jgi:predicted transcriptional regulator/transcription elongation factor Elf1|nr:DUF3987 domain-containing protein [Brasilonema angustatum HA4187-MV1]